MAKYDRMKYALPLAFVVITVFLSLGYEWGNDVPTYERMFEIYTESNFSLFDFQSYELMNEKSEFGFVLINQLCAGIGFWWMRAILFCFENLVIFLLVKRTVPKEWYWLALFVYTMNPNFMILGSSMMRQWLAMCLVVLGFLFLEKRRWIAYVILVLAAATVHRSALLCLPMVILPFLRFKVDQYSLSWLLPAFFIYYFISGVMVDYVTVWLSSEDMYSNYTAAMYSSGVGFMAIVQFLIILFLFMNIQQIDKPRRIYIAALLGFGLILPFYYYSGLASRLGFYFTVFTICAYPLFLKHAQLSSIVKIAFMWAVIIIVVYTNITFFADPNWLRYFGEYTTLMEAGIL